MKLRRAFDIGDREVVSFVGGGGKTTAMFRLADELVEQGKRVVTTTTTRIFASQIQLAPQHLRLENGILDSGKVLEALEQNPHLLVVGAGSEGGKAFGIEPALVDELARLTGVDAVLVEADGSRMRPFKAPAEHEPVIPGSTTLLVPVVGIDVVGKTLTDAHVHRAGLVGSIAGITPGTVLNVYHVARVLGDARGGLKNKPTRARVIALINKVETGEQLAQAREMAWVLEKIGSVSGVAIGAVQNRQAPIFSVESRISAVILAAGGSTRMRGEVKQLLPWGDSTLVANAVRVAEESHVSEIVVVTGNRAIEVQAQLAGKRVRVVENPDWQTGRASSVGVGITAVAENTSGAIFINADQPFLTPKVIDTILNTFFETRAPIVVPTYEGKTSSPVLFAREMFAELGVLSGDQGGRDILQKYRDVLAHVEIADTRAGMDLDTPEEYRRAIETRDAAETTTRT